MSDFPRISDNPKVQAHYEHCRREGTSHALAEMFASGVTPSCLTDSVFLEGHCNGNQFESQPQVGDGYAAEARAAGVDPKGKVYLSGLARFPGDPEAWVSGRGDVQRVCEQRGWGCKGAVSVARADSEPPPPVAVANDIVESQMDRVLATVPDPERVDTEDLREQVTARLSGQS